MKISPLFGLLILFLSWGYRSSLIEMFLFASILVISLLVHELGHALTALFFGQRVEIELFALGGRTNHWGKAVKKWQEFFIVLNGPLFGLMLFFLVSSLARITPYDPWVSLCQVAAFINLFWTLLNLLPIQPLDGGALLRIFLSGLFGCRGLKIAFFLGTLIASFFALTIFLLFKSLLLSSLFFLLAFENYRAWRESLLLSNKDQDETLNQLFSEAQKDAEDGNRRQFYEKLSQIRQSTKKGMLYLKATEEMAKKFCEEGKLEEAFDLLFPHRKILPPPSLHFLHQLAFEINNLKETIEIGVLLYEEAPSASTALLNALAYAKKGEVDGSIGWLKCAIHEGIANLKAVLERPEFDPIRLEPQFKDFTAKVLVSDDSG